MINSFKGEYGWASNFALYGFWYDKVWYPSNEHFFQAMKTLIPEERLTISKAVTPAIAKTMCSLKGYKGFKIVLREDWGTIKNDVMIHGLRQKFQHISIAIKLIVTYPQGLVEGNWWHDNYWGNCSCTKCINIPGQNMLGHLLETVRLELINQT